MAERIDDSGAPLHPIDLFEQLVQEVETIVQRLESGELPLAEAIREYQRGIELIRHCNAILDQAELQISQLRLGGPTSDIGSATEALDFAGDEDGNLPFS